jgi:hypothetical protein
MASELLNLLETSNKLSSHLACLKNELIAIFTPY